jgi:hypothetical protein
MENELWEVTTEVLASEAGRSLGNVEDRAAVRDHLVATLTQTFELRRRKSRPNWNYNAVAHL